MNYETESNFLTKTDNAEVNKLTSLVEDLNLSNKKIRVHFGKIDAIINSLKIITIKPVSPKNLVDLGTETFVLQTKLGSENQGENYILIGLIEDIFGPEDDPMYAVRISSADFHFLPHGEKVYYLKNMDVKLSSMENILD